MHVANVTTYRRRPATVWMRIATVKSMKTMTAPMRLFVREGHAANDVSPTNVLKAKCAMQVCVSRPAT